MHKITFNQFQKSRNLRNVIKQLKCVWRMVWGVKVMKWVVHDGRNIKDRHTDKYIDAHVSWYNFGFFVLFLINHIQRFILATWKMWNFWKKKLEIFAKTWNLWIWKNLEIFEKFWNFWKILKCLNNLKLSKQFVKFLKIIWKKNNFQIEFLRFSTISSNVSMNCRRSYRCQTSIVYNTVDKMDRLAQNNDSEKSINVSTSRM